MTEALARVGYNCRAGAEPWIPAQLRNSLHLSHPPLPGTLEPEVSGQGHSPGNSCSGCRRPNTFRSLSVPHGAVSSTGSLTPRRPSGHSDRQSSIPTARRSRWSHCPVTTPGRHPRNGDPCLPASSTRSSSNRCLEDATVGALSSSELDSLFSGRRLLKAVRWSSIHPMWEPSKGPSCVTEGDRWLLEILRKYKAQHWCIRLVPGLLFPSTPSQSPRTVRR